MKERIILFIKYFLFWFLYFIIWKITFLLYQHTESFKMPISDWFRVLLYGSRLDLSMTGYLMVLPTLIICLTAYFKPIFLKIFFKFYTILFFIVTTFLMTADMPLYSHWGFKLDMTPLIILKNPKEAAGSMNIMEVMITLIISFLVGGFGLFAYFRIIQNKFLNFKKSNWITMIVFLFLTATLILPIRGRVRSAPINVGFVYFSKTNIFANHAATNVVWNVGYSFLHMNNIKADNFMAMEKANEIFKNLYADNGTTQKILKCEKPNIILIIVENFTANITKSLGGLDGVTPNFDSLCKEGILFTNFYSSGDRTMKGIVAIISGYPSQPQTAIAQYESKTQKLQFLNKDLQKVGYNSLWLYGGDLNFGNLNSYFMNAQFNKIITINDFPSDAEKGTWGVHDHVVLERFFEECNQSKTPFFNAMITLSSHEPFIVPMETVIKGDENVNMFLNSAYYTDKSLGEFYQNAKKSTWWDSTLIIITSDHGNEFPNGVQYNDPNRFHIPLLLTGGAVLYKDTTISTICNQTDIALTVLKQMDLDNKEYIYSRNCFSTQTPSFTFYDFNNGFGYMQDSIILLFDNSAKEYILTNGNVDSLDLEKGKAYLQILTNDFLKK